MKKDYSPLPSQNLNHGRVSFDQDSSVVWIHTSSQESPTRRRPTERISCVGSVISVAFTRQLTFRRHMRLFLATLFILCVDFRFLEVSRFTAYVAKVFQVAEPGTHAINPLPIVRTIMTKIPTCKILVTNHRVSYHVEILESILALFPSSSLPLPSTCNRSFLEFNFALNMNPGSESWRRYFFQEMANKRYNGTMYGETRIAGQARFIKSKNVSYVDTIRGKHHASIEASCYCREEFLQLLESRKDSVCIFHERCDQVANNPRAFWLSPHHPRYLFPSVLPFSDMQGQVSRNPPLNLCVIGVSSRRNFSLLEHFLKSLDQEQISSMVRINLLGRGVFPLSLKKYKNTTNRMRIVDFSEFQYTVASDCDIVLPLVNKEGTSRHYFNNTGRGKLSGSIVQGVAYNIPMVIHEDLANLYKSERGTAKWETHSDDPKSFTLALQRLIRTVANVTINSTDHNCGDAWQRSNLLPAVYYR